MTFGELEKAQMRSQFRAMYRDLGFNESLQVLQEIIETATLLAEVIIEEKSSDKI